jgi:DNA-binding NarL/FixJ family response regulator
MPWDRAGACRSAGLVAVGTPHRPHDDAVVPLMDALRRDGLEPRATDELPPARPAAVVCYWPDRPLAEQRRLSRDAVAQLAPHRVVLVTDLDERPALQRLVAEGIHGLVLLRDVATSLAPTVRAVAAGQLCVPAHVRAAIERRPLSLREREILALVIMGLSNGQIARRLHLAESTVKSHLASTFTKLGVRSRAEAAQLVSDPQQMITTGVLGLSAGAAPDD